MKPLLIIFFNVLTTILILPQLEAYASDGSCTGRFRERQVSQEELAEILGQHYQWRTAAASLTRCDSDDPRRANLCGANLSDLSLEGANFDCANMQGARMNRIATRTRTDDFRKRPASFAGANLRDAQFMDAQLDSASFVEADLSRAVFIGARLNNANFGASNLTGADFSRADVSGVLFEPKPGALPTISRMTDTLGLTSLTFVSPHAVAELREAFKKGALRDQERELTYVLKRHELNEANVFEKGFNWVLFDVTSEYGMSPGRPLCILLAFIGIFAVPYLVVLQGRTTAGIWVVWPKDRLPGRPGTDCPERLICQGLNAVQQALYFSLLSAASIGWKDLNVGSWLARIQADEYSLRPTGWVRTMSGVQSLLSVYLLALWALTYFGRPFE